MLLQTAASEGRVLAQSSMAVELVVGHRWEAGGCQGRLASWTSSKEWIGKHSVVKQWLQDSVC